MRELLGLLVTLTSFGAMLLVIAMCTQVLEAIRAAAEWFDYNSSAPAVMGGIAVFAVIAIFPWRRLRRKRGARRQQPVRAGRCQSALWEGQGVIRITDPQTAKIRFVLHSRRKAG